MCQKSGLSPEKLVYEYIKDRIISRELFPGTRLIEAQLADETGVSRTPIREALKKLSYEGIITIVPRKGAFVTAPSYSEIGSVYECKKILETSAIEKASSFISENDLSVLEDLIEKQVIAHKNKNLKEYLQYNDDFHMVIARASKNSIFEKYIRELTEISNVYLIFFDNFVITSVSDSDALAGHRRILDALKMHNKDEAVNAMASHNQTTLDQLNIK